MSGDEMIFDPTMTKKKKKKKKPFMLEEEGGEGEDGVQPEAKEPEVDAGEEKDFDLDEDEGRKKEPTDDLDDLNFFNQKKKKKKPKKDKLFDNELDEGMKELKIEAEPPETLEDDDLMLPAKKKKSKKIKDFQDDTDILCRDDGLEDDDSKNMDEITFSSQTGPAWAGTERDYTYDELLSRVFNIMREKNPDMVAGEKRKFVMKPPQVVRVGTKKTSFVNFTDICKLGVCDVPHVSVPRDHPAEGHSAVLPAVRDVPFPLLRGQHQNRLPGRHRKTSAASCQSQLIPTRNTTPCFMAKLTDLFTHCSILTTGQMSLYRPVDAMFCMLLGFSCFYTADT
uniref:Eukaryotic translation initiation factor 2 subunit beta n=1 Tax=Astyanax mexicanus TaxID=7994 RepID=A0A3B1J2J8_ASTMX